MSEHNPLSENDLDSHANFHNNVTYYTNHEFLKLTQNSCLPKGEDKVSLIHINTSSLLGNLDKLENLLLDHDLDFDFIALHETWHVKSNDAGFTSMCIPGFHPYEGSQGSSKNGGCGSSIRDKLSFHKRNDLNKSSLIDKIFINNVDNNACSGILSKNISDDMPNFLLLDQKLSKFKQKPDFKRDFKNFNEYEYGTAIKHKDLLPMLDTIHLQRKFKHFQNSIRNILNKHAPCKKITE